MSRSSGSAVPVYSTSLRAGHRQGLENPALLGIGAGQARQTGGIIHTATRAKDRLFVHGQLRLERQNPQVRIVRNDTFPGQLVRDRQPLQSHALEAIVVEKV